MSKAAYSVIDGVHRKTKKGYGVVDGVNRKIKKAYSIIGGVARPCWSGGELAYYGTITGLSAVECNKLGASTPNHAIFVGGQDVWSNSTAGYAYDKSLVQTKFTAEAVGATGAGISLGDYAVYFGSSTIYVYDDSLTLVSSSLTLGTTRSYGKAANVGDYVLYAGGKNSSNVYTSVDAVDTSLTRTSATSMANKRIDHAGASIGNKYAIFAGGRINTTANTNFQDSVDAYDASLTKSVAPALSTVRDHATGAKLATYGLIAGGGSTISSTSYTTAVEVYNESLTKSSATPLSVARLYMTSATTDGFALFAGGTSGASSSSYTKSNVESYDDSLTMKLQTSLSVARYEMGSASVGDYMILAGGRISSHALADTGVATVEAYVVA